MTDDPAGDPRSWLDSHGDCLYRYALLHLRSPDLAADLVQETFLEALRARGKFEGRSSARTWLVGILRHKIVDHYRKLDRQPESLNGLDADGNSDPAFDRRGHWRAGPGSWSGDPGREMETREFWDVFKQCLSKLPKGVADAFFLRELDGLSAEEVQDVLGVTPANLWTRLHRARSLLRHCLDVHWFGRRTAPPA